MPTPERAALIRRLASDLSAVEELARNPEWLRGEPPADLIAALVTPSARPPEPVLGLARLWEREPMSAALLRHLRAGDADARERCAWLLATLLASRQLGEAIELALDDAETPQVRRWLAEGLARLSAEGAAGWDRLGAVVDALADHPEAVLRAGALELVHSLPWSERSTEVGLARLHDPDHIVAASAVRVLADAGAAGRIDPATRRELREHPSPLVRELARSLLWVAGSK
jgi:hypothetical protein